MEHKRRDLKHGPWDWKHKRAQMTCDYFIVEIRNGRGQHVRRQVEGFLQ